MLRSLANRLYADFLMPSRLGQYRAILARAAALGYECLSIESFWQAQRLATAGDRRQLVLRHDIDTDAATARKLFAIEREMGVKASGGVRTQEDALTMVAAGANRIGASASVSIVTGVKPAETKTGNPSGAKKPGAY